MIVHKHWQIKERNDHYLVALTDFAFSMMQVLHSINKDCFNDFQLRVGINIGPVVAGVIGASKPQYDIWGDTVNVASRMESTGIMNCIQVSWIFETQFVSTELFSSFFIIYLKVNEETKNILENFGYPCESRGKIYVKGKGEMITYVVKQKEF